MVTLAQTLPCSFRGVTFLMEKSTVIFGRKIIPFEFVNSERRYVQDVGGLLRTYEINAIIHGVDYTSKRKAFIAAINEPGIGIFQHPFDGPVKVVANPATLTEDFKEFGICYISVLFHESRENIFPTQATDNRSRINKLTGDVLAQMEGAVESLYNVTASFRENFEDAKQTLTNISNIADTATKPFSAASGFLSDFSSTLATFKANLITSIKKPALLAANISQLMGALDRLASNPLQRYKINRSMFKMGANKPLFQPPTATVKSMQRKTNRTSINTQVNFDALANAYAAVAQISFQDESQLNAIIQELDTQFNYTLDMTEFGPSELSSILALRNQMRIYLENSRINIEKLVPYNADRQTITNVTYAFYKNLDNDQLLININDISTPNNIQGSIYVVTP